MTYAVGVDLGTTHTAAAVASGGEPRIFELGSERAVVPSIVAATDGTLVTGDAAERRALDDPASAAREFKRRLGDPTPFLLSGTPYGAEALMGRLLATTLDAIRTEMGDAPARVALTHPAAYGPYKLDLLREAARIADVADPVLLSEPEAAATEYAATRPLAEGSVAAVYDLGGGTFDVSLVRRTAAGFEPAGSPGGLERFGGVDVDRAVLGHVRSALDDVFAGLDTSDPDIRRDLVRLSDECRRAKEALSYDTSATVAVRVGGVSRDLRITRSELEDMVRPRLEDTLTAAERVLRDAGLGWDGIAAVLLVGGAGRMPLIAEWLSGATGRPVVLDAHPKHAVALGAARTAAATLGTAPPAAQREPTSPEPATGTVPWSEVQAALEQLRKEGA